MIQEKDEKSVNPDSFERAIRCAKCEWNDFTGCEDGELFKSSPERPKICIRFKARIR